MRLAPANADAFEAGGGGRAGWLPGEEGGGAAGPDGSGPAFSYKQEPTGLEDEGAQAAI